MAEQKLDAYKPKHDTRVQVARTQVYHGEAYYVLHNPAADTYLEIDPHNFFLWELMDGEHALADLAMAYFGKYGVFPFDRLDQLIAQLKANQLLDEETPALTRPTENRLVDRLKRFSETAFQKEFVIKGADAFFEQLYRRGGRILFTRTALILDTAISMVGFVCFVVKEPTETFDLFDINDSYGVGLVVLLMATLFMIFCHEAGHALTCKAYGRSIHKVGFMFYFGMPAFFVDATDLWMAGRRARIAVSLAGPIVNVVLASLLGLVIMVLPVSPVTQGLFQVAFVGYLGALLSLNPLLELDGYYVLMDWVGIPNLRQKSFAFLRGRLLAKIRERSKFHRTSIIYTIYGVLAMAFTALAVLISVYIWENELKTMLHDLQTGQDLLAAVLLGGFTLVAGTALVLGLAARVVVFTSAQCARVCALVKKHARK
jgi:putative peptide zinc metalloprotease protein